MDEWAAAEAQRDEIRRAVAASQPLVGEREPLTALQEEYAANNAFTTKLAEVAARYAAFRRVRGDGSCFYRAFLVGITEHLVEEGVVRPSGFADAEAFAAAAPPGAALVRAPALPPALPGPAASQARYEGWLTLARDSLPALVARGWSAYTAVDFRDAFLAWLWALGRDGAAAPPVDPAAALRALGFRDAEETASFYVLTYLRCLCALELRAHEDDYAAWVEALAPECASVRQFCDAHVEAVHTDADSLQVLALATAFGVTCSIAYVDAAPSGAGGGGSSGALTTITIPDDAAGAGEQPPPARPTLRFLYRPGHYDVVYPRS